VVEVEEVIRFWHDYERARVANQRLIELQVVRSAVKAIAALEAEVERLGHELEDAWNDISHLQDEVCDD
jgi:predicted phage tail protein